MPAERSCDSMKLPRRRPGITTDEYFAVAPDENAVLDKKHLCERVNLITLEPAINWSFQETLASPPRFVDRVYGER